MKKYQLMAPGPTPVPSEALLAMAQPMIHHRTPEYEALFIEVRAGLKRLFQTEQDVVPFTSSGTGAMEAAVVSTLSPGDTVLVLRAGNFGKRWEEICRAYGLDVTAVAAPFHFPGVSSSSCHHTPEPPRATAGRTERARGRRPPRVEPISFEVPDRLGPGSCYKDVR